MQDIFPIMQDAGINNGGQDGPFNNALIAEMEADMYGLQVHSISTYDVLSNFCQTYPNVCAVPWSTETIIHIKDSWTIFGSSWEVALLNSREHVGKGNFNHFRPSPTFWLLILVILFPYSLSLSLSLSLPLSYRYYIIKHLSFCSLKLLIFQGYNY